MSSSSSSQSSTGGDLVIEEDEQGFCNVDGSIDTDNAGYTGAGFANTTNAPDTGINWRITVSDNGNYDLTFRYASTTERPADILVDGNTQAAVDFPATADWATWLTTTVTVSLTPGSYDLSLIATGDSGLANIDSLTISGSAQAANCETTVTTPPTGPMLSQTGNPVYSRFNKYTDWHTGSVSGDEAFADILLSYQLTNGGFPKNQEYTSMGSGGSSSGTIDNGATTTEMTYLADIYQRGGQEKYRTAARAALDFLLEMQYSTGAFPQFYPLRGNYYDHATFNDDAMSRALVVLDKANNNAYPFDSDVFTTEQKAKLQNAINLGIDYILKSQWTQDGTLTVWCAQHGAFDYQPKQARAYELVSLSGSESVEVIAFLMTQPQSTEIETAVKAALAWFRSPNTYLADYTYDKTVEEKFVASPGSKVWYRFYDLDTNAGFFSDRDSRKVYDIMDISEERRNGYSWGGGYGDKIISYANSVGY
jgi:pectate lyase, PelA/Pel-15E family